jgi:CTP:phosphocholine cytidylyltransferase-like protein
MNITEGTKRQRDNIKAFSVAYSKVSCQKLANLYKNKMNEPERAKIIWDEFNKKKIKRLSDNSRD